MRTLGDTPATVVRRPTSVGGDDFDPNGTSGVYATFPMGQRPKNRNSSHIDSSLDSRQRLSIAAYIDDVAPGGGSFMVWPGSHHLCNNFIVESAQNKLNGYGKPASERKNLSGGPDDRPTVLKFD